MDKKSYEPQRGFFPAPMYLIGCYIDEATPNFTLITRIELFSVEPPMLLFSSDGEKMVRELVVQKRAFSASLVTAGMALMADYCANTSGYDLNKAAEFGIEFSKGHLLNVPVINKSPFVYECSLADTIDYGVNTIYIGKIENILVDENIDLDSVNPSVFDPLVHARGNYFRLGECAGKFQMSMNQIK